MKGQGHAAMGSHDRSSHEQHSSVHKAHDHEAGRLRTSGATVSGAKFLVKRDKATLQNEALFEVEVKGPSVLVRWGKAERASDLKHEVKTFPDALLAERWVREACAELCVARP
jgi:hypothetical protein